MANTLPAPIATTYVNAQKWAAEQGFADGFMIDAWAAKCSSMFWSHIPTSWDTYTVDENGGLVRNNHAGS